jgi:hypothetical protein
LAACAFFLLKVKLDGAIEVGGNTSDCAGKQGFARFGYSSLADWASRIIDCPAKTLVLGREREDDFAVLEEHEDTFKLPAYFAADARRRAA